MVKVTRRPLCIQPNAGVPFNLEGRNIYPTTPKYMAKYAKRMIQAGVRIVGGCCGTTPSHIREIRNEIRALSPRVSAERIHVSASVKALEPTPLARKSRWGAKLAQGQFVTCVELVPPRGVGLEKLLEHARILKEHGIDAVNVPDSPRAQAKMSALLATIALQQQTGVEAIPHYTCKDKNLLALQADLLGAYALGVRNILLVTGDPPNMGTYPDATAVFNLDAIGLCNLVKLLNRGIDLGGNPVGKPTEFCYGVALNPSAISPERELDRLRQKLDGGAEFAITQPVFDAEGFLRFRDRLRGLADLPIVAGVWPLVSLRNAEFMKHEVPGLLVPDSIIDRMSRCDTKEAGIEEGIAIAREMLDELRGSIAGVQVAAPMGKVQYALQVIGAGAAAP